MKKIKFLSIISTLTIFSLAGLAYGQDATVALGTTSTSVSELCNTTMTLGDLQDKFQLPKDVLDKFTTDTSKEFKVTCPTDDTLILTSVTDNTEGANEMPTIITLKKSTEGSWVLMPASPADPADPAVTEPAS